MRSRATAFEGTACVPCSLLLTPSPVRPLTCHYAWPPARSSAQESAQACKAVPVLLLHDQGFLEGNRLTRLRQMFPLHPSFQGFSVKSLAVMLLQCRRGSFHAIAVKCHYNHVIVMSLQCRCGVYATAVTCYCDHVIVMSLQCRCGSFHATVLCQNIDDDDMPSDILQWYNGLETSGTRTPALIVESRSHSNTQATCWPQQAACLLSTLMHPLAGAVPHGVDTRGKRHQAR
eukprot:scaffold12037_cov19-Tisochrysis_lutea.AAC.1